MERRGKVRIQEHRNRKDEILMDDYSRLNTMGVDELRAFARFAYTAYPTLLETHEIRQAFFRDHPDKSPYTHTAGPTQLELPFTQEVDSQE